MASSPSNPSCRVVQWSTGNIGTRALRAVIEHPHLELAGVYAASPEKSGRDAGDLCGAGSTGIAATADIDEILALKADCVLYMPLMPDMDDICRILASGTNIVTTCGDFHHPGSMDPTLRQRIEAACAEGGTSIHSTGSSPGFITEAVPLVLTSIQRRLDTLTIDEYADLSRRDSPDLLFGVMGFGQPVAAFNQARVDYVASHFGPSLRVLADAVSLPLDSVTALGETAAARHRTEIAAGTLDAGTLAAQRVTVTGLRDGQPLARFRATWYCTTDVDADWDFGDSGWHISVEGDAPLDVNLRLAVPIERMAELAPGFTAHRAVNAVPSVCAAQPGIRSTLDLPQIIAQLG